MTGAEKTTAPHAQAAQPGLGLRLLRLIGHQHWIRRGRDRLLRSFCDPDHAPPLAFTVPFSGLAYPGRLDNFIDWSVYFLGGYARHELLLLRDLARALQPGLPRKLTFVDVGANIGNHSLFMAAQGARVLAFEPYGPAAAKLLEKVRANPGFDISVFEFGLGDRDGELQFRPPVGANIGTGSFASREGHSLTLSVQRGDEVFERLQLPPIDLLKIDVEGFEPNVLQGLHRRLRADRPLMLFELSEAARERFGSRQNMEDALYPDHLILEVATRSLSGPYRLLPFDFARSSEALVLAAEKAGLLKGRGRWGSQGGR